MAKQGQGVALDPPEAKPLDLKYMKIYSVHLRIRNFTGSLTR